MPGTSGCRIAEDGAEEERGYLERAWERYREQYVQPAGYVTDVTRDGGEVTSEGQSYAMLRAVWMRDKEAFDRIYRWTEEQLRRDDGLYSWHWTAEDGGRVVDRNTATDGDQLAAFALLLAADAFGRPEYRERTRELLAAIREHAAIELEGGWIPAAGNWAVEERITNLSYFLPFAYPYFQRVHPAGDWLQARDAGYDLIRRWLERGDVRLPGAFVRITAEGGPVPVDSASGLEWSFSFDAVRTYWNVAVDCILHGDIRPCSDPLRTETLAELMGRDGGIRSRYTLAGEALTREESPSFYGALLPALALHRPVLADAVRRTRLHASRRDSLLETEVRYFDRNWVWFGLAVDRGVVARRTPPPEQITP